MNSVRLSSPHRGLTDLVGGKLNDKDPAPKCLHVIFLFLLSGCGTESQHYR